MHSKVKRLDENTEKVQTVVIGGGQAGLAMGHELARLGLPFVILDANERVGDPWRRRWDSLRLFTSARYDGLPGMPFPAAAHSFPTKNEMADYLEAYAAKFDLPVRSAVRVDKLSRVGRKYVISAGTRRFEAEQVVVAMSAYQVPRVPAFAKDLAPNILQMHSSEYRNPTQLRDGGVLIVGAGNSGSEIALEVSRSHRTWLSGRDTGHIPFRIDGLAARLFLARLVLRVVFHRILTIRTPMGRRARSRSLSQSGPLIRIRPQQLIAAHVERVPRVAGVDGGGLPRVADGREMDVSNVIWSTGFHPGFSWIDLPVLGENGWPKHDAGVADDEPGLYFTGLAFTYAFSSTMIHGLERDAKRIGGVIRERTRRTTSELKCPEPVEQSAERASIQF